jgi:hypothetical protein
VYFLRHFIDCSLLIDSNDSSIILLIAFILNLVTGPSLIAGYMLPEEVNLYKYVL